MPNVKVWTLKNTKFSVSYLTLWIMFASKYTFVKKKKDFNRLRKQKSKKLFNKWVPKIRVSVSRSATNVVQIYGIRYTIYTTLLITLLICLVKHLPKCVSLPLISEDLREGLVRFEEKNVFIGFQKSNLIVLLIFSLLLLQYEIYSVCNAIVIIFLIEKQFFLNQFYVT